MGLILSKLTSKAQTTVPKDVRKALGLKAGDAIAYDIMGDHVVLRKAAPTATGIMTCSIACSRIGRALKTRKPTTGFWTTNDRRHPWAVVVVPFPFTDLPVSKPRPAVALSERHFQDATAQTVLAMITRGARSSWPSDVPIGDLDGAGLPEPSIVRARIGTVENRFIARQIGILSELDRDSVVRSFRESIVSF